MANIHLSINTNITKKLFEGSEKSSITALYLPQGKSFASGY